MSYIGAGTATKATALDNDTVETADIQNGAVTADKLSTTAVTDKLGYTPANQATTYTKTETDNLLAPKATTGKAIAMSIVFGG